MVSVDKQNYNGAIGLPMETVGAFIVGKGDQIQFYDISTYKVNEECTIQIPLI